MDPIMKHALLWNMLAWLAWGVLILALRYRVERQQQKIAADEAQAAMDAIL
jgi:heme exporter protein C